MIVNESIGDILKPKRDDEIKSELDGIIFLKGIIEGKLSPEALKFTLATKKQLKDIAQELGINRPLVLRIDKILLWLYYKLKITDFNITPDLKNSINNKLNRWKSGTSGVVMGKQLENVIDEAYKKANITYKRVMGKDLREHSKFINFEKINSYDVY